MEEYRELSDKIERVKDELVSQMTTVLVEMGKLSATVTSGLSIIGDLKSDVDKIKEISTKAKDSTESAHKRLDELIPLRDANLIDRVKRMEDINKFIGVTVGGAIILAIMGLILLKK